MAAPKFKLRKVVIKGILTGEGIERSFGVAFEAIPRKLVLMGILMAGDTVIESNIRKLLKLLTIFSGYLMTFNTFN